MASCSLQTSNIRILNLQLRRGRVGVLQLCGIRTWTGRKPLQYPCLVTSQDSQRAEKLFTVFCSPTIESQSVTRLEDGSEEIKSFGSTSKLIPNFNEVESLITEVCDTSSIAELELKLGGFSLHVTRDLAEKISPPPAPILDSGSATKAESPDSNKSVSTSSLAISKPVPSSGGIQRLLDTAADEGLVIINSPRVGFFRRSRTIKGKRAPPSCKEKQVVKEGQVVCYIEQLGGELPIESDVAGEIVKILRQDGDPIGYGDALIAVLPSFPGIKKLQ
ncbi:Biotin carboxyl carrier protein of acetyl-CoA carboxylase [Quillaja saponaria]|uniref:Biotin carboxyl carrier protein of acetyl-CoA carboxylase n=1 Tax=Quillaja saponaria TaxID=32244 RepID=A0AAD7L5C9_QUISA|nr:Biotin carboxyl carrier protein of acetyl-CoA carboxylase [Quillaja saponaria]